MPGKSKQDLYDIVRVEWLDAVSRDEWDSSSDPIKPCLIASVGHLINDEPDFVELAGNYDPENDQTSCVMCIPRGMITSIQTLKVANERRTDKPRARRRPR